MTTIDDVDSGWRDDDPSTLPPDDEDDDAVDEDAVERVAARGPGGAFAVAGLATALVVAIYVGFYLWFYLPRGAVQ